MGGSPTEGGIKHGGTGLTTATGQSLKIANWLVGMTPAAVNRQVVSQAQQCGVRLDVKSTTLFPRSMAPRDAVRSVEVHGGTRDERLALADRIDTLLDPTPEKWVEAWLVDLESITATRRRDGFANDVALAAYVSRVKSYPPDAVRHALVTTRWHWFPSWAELADCLDASVSGRRAMARALRREPEQKDERAPPTQAQKLNAQALVDSFIRRRKVNDDDRPSDTSDGDDTQQGDSAADQTPEEGPADSDREQHREGDQQVEGSELRKGDPGDPNGAGDGGSDNDPRSGRGAA